MDKSEESIDKLNEIIAAEEECEGIQTGVYNIESASIEDDYDLIMSLVVLQFISRDTMPAVIKNMQDKTREGGYNLIVAPLSTDDMPCPIDLPFTFGENELRNYYENWRIHKYNENVGHFQKNDEDGNPYQARFATLLAQK